MLKYFSNTMWFRLLLIAAVALLLGLSPRPHSLNVELRTMRQAVKDSHFQQATQSLEYVLKFYSWRNDLWIEAGHLAFQGEDYDSAILFLERVSRSGEFSPEDWLVLGDAYQRRGDLEAAQLTWEQAINVGGDPVVIYKRLLELHSAQADYASMIEDLKRLFLLEPTQVLYPYRLGLYLAAQSPQDALEYLEIVALLDHAMGKKVDKLTQNIRASLFVEEPAYSLVQAGRALAAMDEWELASRAFRKSVALRPDYAEGWAFLAEARQHVGNNKGESAIADLQQAIMLDPDSVIANSLTALYWHRQGEYSKALEYQKVAVSLEPYSPDLQVELGQLYAYVGDLQNARAAYESAYELSHYEFAYQQYLIDFFLQHEFQIREVALPLARQAVLSHPEDVQAWLLMGRVFFMLGDSYSALRYFEHALQLNPASAQAFLEMGSVYLYQGDTEQAKALLSRAQQLAPQSSIEEQAQRLLQYYFP